jgi:hypothetical protein
MPAAFDWAIASTTAAFGIEPSAFARWAYIQSSAPTGSAVTCALASKSADSVSMWYRFR